MTTSERTAGIKYILKKLSVQGVWGFQPEMCVCWDGAQAAVRALLRNVLYLCVFCHWGVLQGTGEPKFDPGQGMDHSTSERDGVSLSNGNFTGPKRHLSILMA